MFEYTEKELKKIFKENLAYVNGLPKEIKEKIMMEILNQAKNILIDIGKLEVELDGSCASFMLALSIYTCLRMQSLGHDKDICFKAFKSAWNHAVDIRDELIRVDQENEKIFYNRFNNKTS